MDCDALAGSTVLLVEDEPLIGMMIEASLLDAGAEVLWASNQSRAYELITLHVGRIHVLVTDIYLGEGPSGLDVAEFARGVNAAIPVIYMSGCPPESLPSLENEDTRFLMKPFIESNLLSIARTLIERGGSARALDR